METTHVTPELLDAMIHQDLPPGVLSRLLWDHVRALCPVCRTHLDQWLESNRARRVGFGDLPPEESDRRASTAARDDLGELLQTPRDERLEKIGQADDRFRSARLVDLLVEGVEEQVHDDPREAVHLAGLARAVAERVEGPGRLERLVRATAHLANALRVSSDYPAADHTMRQARDLLADGAGVDPRVFAEVDRLEAAEGYVALGVGYDAALSYLDLAETLLAQNKSEEVAHLSAALEPVLQINDLTEEALASLVLFRNAADQRALTASVVERVRRRLVRSREGG